MNILHVSFEDPRDPIGGMGVHIDNLAKHQAHLGHDVTVLSCNTRNLEFYDGRRNGYRLLLAGKRNPYMGEGQFLQFISLNDSMTETLIYFLKHLTFDIIHCHDGYNFNTAKYAQILCGGKIVFSCHLSNAIVDFPFPDESKEFYSFEWQKEADAIHNSSAVICNSASYREQVELEFQGQRLIHVIHNGVNFEELQEHKRSDLLNKHHGKGKPLVGFVGRFAKSKGVEILAEAIQALPQFHFLMVSNVSGLSGKMPRELHQMQEVEKTCSNLTWIKNMPNLCDEKWAIMASCDMGLVPSLSEPWGIVAQEWAALRVPKIVTSVGGLLEHNDPSDSIMINATADALIHAISSFSRNEELVTAAHERAKTFSWKNIAQQNLKVYEEISHGHRHRHAHG